MSKTTRHRDFWKMRQLSKASRGPRAYGSSPASPDFEFDRLWSKYGRKSMVFDKRRRVSTR